MIWIMDGKKGNKYMNVWSLFLLLIYIDSEPANQVAQKHGKSRREW